MRETEKLEVFENYQDPDEAFWKSFMGSDEIKTELHDKQYVVQQHSEAINPNNTISTVKHGGGSFMLDTCYWDTQFISFHL